MRKLLEGVRVIECATLLNGDTVGMLLGDLGADVIKVESLVGDYVRDAGDVIVPRHSPSHLEVNRNKRSLSLNLASAEGREIFYQLLETADVFVDGWVPGACEKLGIGLEDQRKVKPDIIYCQFTGFGAHGPYAPIPCHGQMMTSVAGAFPRRVDDDGFVTAVEPRETPGAETGGEATAVGATHAALAVVSALLRRMRDGEGCYIDVSGADAVIASAHVAITNQLNHHRLTNPSPPSGAGTTSGHNGARYQFYQTRDKRFLLFCAIEKKFFNRFCVAAGRPDLVDDSQGNEVVWGAHEVQLRRDLQEVFATRDLDEWITLAATEQIPMAPANDLGDLQGDPQLHDREIFYEGVHPYAGPYTSIGSPVVVDGQPFDVRLPAPIVGEHTQEVLGELGIPADRIDKLAADGVLNLGDPPPSYREAGAGQ
jgi:crotonobetainyl-CoA:carnitine CoA-transferase CaiB-like acyl-CoA transferase